MVYSGGGQNSPVGWGRKAVAARAAQRDMFSGEPNAGPLHGPDFSSPESLSEVKGSDFRSLHVFELGFALNWFMQPVFFGVLPFTVTSVHLSPSYFEVSLMSPM